MSTMDAEARRKLMARFRGNDTKPEILVRRALHRAGRRFRVNVRNLPGKPDIVMRRDKTIVMVHGCFWHAHDKCPIARIPRTRPDFWKSKFAANKARDERVRLELEELGWRVVTLWECEARASDLDRRLEELGLIELSVGDTSVVDHGDSH